MERNGQKGGKWAVQTEGTLLGAHDQAGARVRAEGIVDPDGVQGRCQLSPCKP